MSQLFDGTVTTATVEEQRVVTRCLSKDTMFRLRLGDAQSNYHLGVDTTSCIAEQLDAFYPDGLLVSLPLRTARDVLDPSELEELYQQNRDVLWSILMCGTKEEWTRVWRNILNLQDFGIDQLRCFVNELDPDLTSELFLAAQRGDPLFLAHFRAAESCGVELQTLLVAKAKPTPTPAPAPTAVPAVPAPTAVPAATPASPSVAPDFEFSFYPDPDYPKRPGEFEQAKRLSDPGMRGFAVLLHFWHSGCSVCSSDILILDKAHRSGRWPSTHFLGVETFEQRDPDRAQLLLQDLGVSYPLVFDRDGQVARDYGLHDAPATILLDADHNIVSTWYDSLTEDVLEELLSNIAQPKSGTPPVAALPGRPIGSPPPMFIDPALRYFAVMKLAKDPRAVITIELFADRAPVTVNNFVWLAKGGYYDGVSFHRVIPGFMAQTGDPTGTGGGGPGYSFDDEFHPGLGHDSAGIVSMAGAGPNTNGSQFFITLAPTPHLDGLNPDGSLKDCAASGVSCHSVFGRVVDGMEHVLSIRERDPSTDRFQGDVVEEIFIIETAPRTAPRADIGPGTAGGAMASNFGIVMFQGQDMVGGDEIELYSLLGEKPLVLNFWAGLKFELSEMQRFHEEYGDRVLVLGVNIGGAVGPIAQDGVPYLVKEAGATYPVGYTEDLSVIESYGVSEIPSTVFINADGSIATTSSRQLTKEVLMEVAYVAWGMSVPEDEQHQYAWSYVVRGGGELQTSAHLLQGSGRNPSVLLGARDGRISFLTGFDGSSDDPVAVWEWTAAAPIRELKVAEARGVRAAVAQVGGDLFLWPPGFDEVDDGSPGPIELSGNAHALDIGVGADGTVAVAGAYRGGKCPPDSNICDLGPVAVLQVWVNPVDTGRRSPYSWSFTADPAEYGIPFVTFGPSGNLIVGLATDTRIFVWDSAVPADPEEAPPTTSFPMPNPIRDVKAVDGGAIILKERDSGLNLLTADLALLSVPSSSQVRHFDAVSEDGGVTIVGYEETGRIRVWQHSDGEEAVRPMNDLFNPVLSQDSEPIEVVEIATWIGPAGEPSASISLADGRVIVWAELNDAEPAIVKLRAAVARGAPLQSGDELFLVGLTPEGGAAVYKLPGTSQRQELEPLAMHVPRGSVREVSHVKNQDGLAHIAAVDDYGRLYFWARVDAESPSSEPTWHLPEHYNIRSMDMFLTKSDGVVVCAGSDTHVHCWDRAELLSGAEPEPLWSRETGGQVRRLRLLPGDGRWPRLLAATAVIFSHGILEYWESVLESGPSWRYESPHGWMEYLDAFVDASGDVHVFATHSKGKVAEGKAESTSYYWRKAQEIEGDQPAPSWSAPNEGYFSQVEAIPGESGPGLVVALRPLGWKEGLSELRFYELGPGDPELVSSQQLKSRNNRGDEFWKEFSSIDTALDPDSGDRFLAVGYWSPYEIELWRSRSSEPNKWEPVWSFDTGDHIRSANVFGHDTQGRPYLFVGSYDNNLYSWNPDQLRTGQPTQTEFDHWVWDVDVEPQEGGVSVVVGTADGLIAYYPSFK